MSNLRFVTAGVDTIQPKGEIQGTNVGSIVYALYMGAETEVVATESAIFVFNQDLIRVLGVKDLKASVTLYYGEFGPSHYGVFSSDADFLADYQRIYSSLPLEYCSVGNHYFIGQLMDSKALAA